MQGKKTKIHPKQYKEMKSKEGVQGWEVGVVSELDIHLYVRIYIVFEQESSKSNNIH